MQRATQTIDTRSRRRKATARPASRTSILRPAAHVLTLAPASPLSLPTLAGIPTKFVISDDTQLLAPVASALIEHGVADRDKWEESKQQLGTFIELAMDELIANEGGNAITDHMEMYVSLTDVSGYYGPKDGDLRIELQVGNCGFMCVGSTLDALEAEVPGLAAAFYAHLVSALHMIGWAYDWHNAEANRDSQLEMIAEENSLDCAEDVTPEILAKLGYEVPDLDGVIPAHAGLKDAVEKPTTHCTPEHLEMLKSHSDGPNAAAIEILLRLWRYAQAYRKAPSHALDNSSLPSFLLAFRPNDQIVAAFDEYSQTALEGDESTVYVRLFHHDKPKEVRTALRSFTAIVKCYAAACELADLMMPNKEDEAHED